MKNNRWFVLFCLFYLFFNLNCAAIQRPHEEQSRFDHMLDSSVALVRHVNGNNHSVCSGTWISQSAILTAAHCLLVVPDGFPLENLPENLVQIFIQPNINVVTYQQFLSNGLSNSTPFRATHIDYSRDLALLTTELSFALPHDISSISTRDEYPVGAQVYSVGHPLEIYFNVSVGIISRIPSDLSEVQIFHTSMNLYFGSSGGGLFDENGRLIGVAHTIVQRESWLSCFVGVQSLRQFLIEN